MSAFIPDQFDQKSKRDLIEFAQISHENNVKLIRRVKELEKELTLSTDQNDLLLDEFIRVKHLTDNTEIHGLCERAHVRMRQNVSVIDRNHQLERKVSELKHKVNSLENSDGGLLLKALFYAPSSPVSAAKAEEIESWYEKVKRLNKEKNSAQA